MKTVSLHDLNTIRPTSMGMTGASKICIVTAMLWAVVSMPAQAAGPQWKWRNANGTIQYSDLPPPASVPAKDILKSPPSAAPRGSRPINDVPGGLQPGKVYEPNAEGSADANKDGKDTKDGKTSTGTDAELQASKKAQDEALKAQGKTPAGPSPAEAAKQKAIRAENCKMAKGHLLALQNGERMAIPNDKGERVILDDTMRQREIVRTQAVVKDQCAN